MYKFEKGVGLRI